MSLSLPDTIYSPDQISATVLELNNYRASLADAAVRARRGSQNHMPREPGALLVAMAEAAAVDLRNTSALDELRKQLESLLSKAPVAHITLAAIPTHAIKRQLTTWFREHISPDMLLTFTARGDLGGGIVLQAGSHVYDFSFKRRLVADRQRIAEIASRV